MPSTTRGKNRTSGSAQRRLHFDEQDKRTGDEITDIDDDSPQSTNSSRSNASLRKRSPVSSFESPAPRKKQNTVVVTPEAEKEDLSKYVPTYIHKNVEYRREGSASLPNKTVEVFQWICNRYEIPADFEQQRFFGPLSGTSYEQRIIAEYKLGKLDRKGDAPDDETLICSGCAQTGHIRDDCPSLI